MFTPSRSRTTTRTFKRMYANRGRHNLSRAPVAHWDAFGRGSSHCIPWYQIRQVLTACNARYHTVLGER